MAETTNGSYAIMLPDGSWVGEDQGEGEVLTDFVGFAKQYPSRDTALAALIDFGFGGRIYRIEIQATAEDTLILALPRPEEYTLEDLTSKDPPATERIYAKEFVSTEALNEQRHIRIYAQILRKRFKNSDSNIKAILDKLTDAELVAMEKTHHEQTIQQITISKPSTPYRVIR